MKIFKDSIIDDDDDIIVDDDFDEFDFDEDEIQIRVRAVDAEGEEKPQDKKEEPKKGSCYLFLEQQKLAEGEVPLGKVVGHEKQKKEILAVIDWFKHSKELKARGVSIPKGVILFGHPGNGKSLLMKEIIKCCEAPVFVFQGDKSNICEGIIETFDKARKAGHSIIVIDELDLLINRERRVMRVLQECLDGVESSDDILVLTATNEIREIPYPLKRNGRLEKLIMIPYPTGEEALTLFKKYFQEFGVALPKDFDEAEVSLSLNGISCAGVKAVVNDIVLRNGFENITSKMIDDSIFNITERVKDGAKEDNLSVAMHEAGHAVMAKAFSQFFLINRIDISGASGTFHAKEVEEDFWSYSKVKADIQISMAGVIAQKVIMGEGSRGCDSDLNHARRCAYNLFNRVGYSSCWETLPEVEPGSRIETQKKRRRMERKIERLLKSLEKKTCKYVKKNKDKIIALGNALFEKKHLKSSEILSIIG